MFAKLKGYKTYITAALTIAGAAAAYVTGETTAVDALQLAIPALLSAFVRHGLQS